MNIFSRPVRRVIRGVFGALVLIAAPFAGGGYYLLSKNPAAAATLTDNYLRPLFGDEAIIAFEGFVFNLQDKAHQISEKAPDAAALIPNVKTVSAAETEPKKTIDEEPPPAALAPVRTDTPL